MSSAQIIRPVANQNCEGERQRVRIDERRSARELRNAQDKKGAGKPAASTVALDAKLLVSRKVAAQMLSISIRALDYIIADGRLPTRRIANRVLISTEEVRKFARSDHPEKLAV
jgi:hypothetical protein